MESNHPAVMLLLLSREQTLGFHLHKWVRSATELTDLANAASRRADPPVNKFCTAMIETTEADQERFSSAIQGLTGVIGQPAASTPPAMNQELLSIARDGQELGTWNAVEVARMFETGVLTPRKSLLA